MHVKFSTREFTWGKGVIMPHFGDSVNSFVWSTSKRRSYDP